MKIYVVRSGDNVDEIAMQYGVPVWRIIEDNQLVYPYELAVGQALLIGDGNTIGTGREIMSNGYAYPFISRWVLNPILRLSQAMGQVAKGDFHVRLNEEHLFGDIEDIYHNFNLMTQELGNTETIQTDFVVNVSHEFKTPINAIEGYATLLQAEEDSSPQDRRRYVEKILYNTRRLSKLVSNILLLSKVDHQAISAQGSCYRLDEQIRQSIVQLEPEWEKKDIELDVELEDLSYTGNESLMLHVWDNLIGNAIKFSPPGGLVGVSLKREGEQAVFRVEDCGPGIDEASLSHIFE